MMRNMDKIAIDVGGVLIEKKNRNGNDTNFDIDDVKWIDGALQAIEKLSQCYDIYILSFCGKKTEMETRLALKKEVSRLVPESKWIFTRAREHKVKKMKEYNITTLVDDTPSIIQWVMEANLKGILYGSKEYPTWKKVVETLTSSKK